jgi:threonine dehydrogenase-like Zn-dependent dehydrogenase
VCHSDIHIQDGIMDMGGGRKVEYGKVGFTLPHTLGHEIVGEVVALGPDAAGAKIGDKRVVFPWIGCGKCEFCKRGEELLCANGRALGVRAAGGYADHVLVPHPKYLVDFSGVNEALAATYACSGLTAYSALRKLAHLGAEETIVIIGAGGVGLSAVMIAPAAVKARIVVADISDRKRDAALKAGAAAVYDNNDKDAVKALRAATQFAAGDGAVRRQRAAARRHDGAGRARRRRHAVRHPHLHAAHADHHRLLCRLARRAEGADDAGESGEDSGDPGRDAAAERREPGARRHARRQDQRPRGGDALKIA